MTGREGKKRRKRVTKSQRGEGRGLCNDGGTQGILKREGYILIFVHLRVSSYATADGAVMST